MPAERNSRLLMTGGYLVDRDPRFPADWAMDTYLSTFRQTDNLAIPNLVDYEAAGLEV